MKESINKPRAWRLAVALTGLYAAIWLMLEGALIRDLVLAAALLALGLWRVAGRVPRRAPTGAQRVGLAAVAGLAFGAGLPPLTLFLMALKTGLHAHGPEYTAAQIAWLLAQWAWWAGAGLLTGAGVGLVWAGLRR